MSGTLVMILAGGASEELPVLTGHRSKAAMPYGGRYRIIDFCLSNSVNSGMYDVGVLAQYSPASLIAHIGNGRPWDLDRRTGGVMILQPYVGKTDQNWFLGTADALWRHIQVIHDSPCEDVLLLSADQVYKMNYNSLIGYHRAGESAVTVVVKPSAGFVPGRYGAVDVDERGQIKSFLEKPEHRTFNHYSLGIYAFKKSVLVERLSVAREGRHDIVLDVVIPLVGEARARAFVFNGYWADVGWLESYYQSSISLVSNPSLLDLSDRSWRIYTNMGIRPPTVLGKNADVRESLVANGCSVDGTVTRSVLFPGVTIAAGTTVEDSIVFSDATVEAEATVRHAVVDKMARIGRGAFVGFGNSTCPNSLYPEALSSGITVIGKRSTVPDDARIGRNCLIGRELPSEAFPSRDIVCGETILGEETWQKISS
ncbi:MAG: sugar phosphate nucleotidyltransferase [bacterium]